MACESEEPKLFTGGEECDGNAEPKQYDVIGGEARNHHPMSHIQWSLFDSYGFNVRPCIDLRPKTEVRSSVVVQNFIF